MAPARPPGSGGHAPQRAMASGRVDGGSAQPRLTDRRPSRVLACPPRSSPIVERGGRGERPRRRPDGAHRAAVVGRVPFPQFTIGRCRWGGARQGWGRGRGWRPTARPGWPSSPRAPGCRRPCPPPATPTYTHTPPAPAATRTRYHQRRRRRGGTALDAEPHGKQKKNNKKNRQPKRGSHATGVQSRVSDGRRTPRRAAPAAPRQRGASAGRARAPPQPLRGPPATAQRARRRRC